MDENEKRVDLNSELGMSRRDLLRRGAVVGGTLLWAAPAIQSLSAKAWAQDAGSPGACATCYCAFKTDAGNVRRDECNKDGVTGIFASAETCHTFCLSGGSAGVTYNFSDYCQGTGFNCNCSSKTAGNPPPFGVNCV